MSEQSYPPEVYLLAHDLLRHIGQNLAIQFQIEGDNFDHDMMQKHVNDRAAIIHVQKILLNEGEKLVQSRG